MQFVISLLKQKKKDIFNEIVDFDMDQPNVLAKCRANELIIDQLNKAIKTLEHEYYWKELGKDWKPLGLK